MKKLAWRVEYHNENGVGHKVSGSGCVYLKTWCVQLKSLGNVYWRLDECYFYTVFIDDYSSITAVVAHTDPFLLRYVSVVFGQT